MRQPGSAAPAANSKASKYWLRMPVRAPRAQEWLTGAVLRARLGAVHAFGVRGGESQAIA
jgi:hypothetical protein